jgi:hypothetical protein
MARLSAGGGHQQERHRGRVGLILDQVPVAGRRGHLDSTQERTGVLQLRQGHRSVVDGPFAESKEMVGGFFLLDVPTLDAALDIAAECPAAQWATVEVRATGPCYAST